MPRGAEWLQDSSQFEGYPMLERRVPSLARILVMISGGGTNLQEVIDQTESQDIPGYIAGVVSNNEKAYGLERCERHGIPHLAISSEGINRYSPERALYEAIITNRVKKINPDLVVLAGWMLVLEHDFLPEMEGLGIPTLNLHPALLPDDGGDVIETSVGLQKVVRGAHAIRAAYDDNEIKVTGVTTHLLRPKQGVDLGPVILRQEVAKITEEPFASFERRVHEAEYCVLPEAIRRVLFVMRELKIDITRADFPWKIFDQVAVQ